MQDALDGLNLLPAKDAEAPLLACCRSQRWAREMVARRPFTSIDQPAGQLQPTKFWRRLGREDWLEAFAAHPQIGEERAEKPVELGAARELSTRWSVQEQSAAAQRHGPDDVAARLAEGNRTYRERFGYIFIVCATGKTAAEMLAILERRLQNDAAAELPVAAEEQRKIMQLRLRKLLEVRSS